MNKVQKFLAKNLLGIKSFPGFNARISVVNGQVVWMADNSEEYITKGYQANDIVYSAINIVTDKIRIAPWSLFKVVDESSLKRYKAALQSNDYNQAVRFQRKALQPMENFNLRTGKWAELLKWVNEYETFGDFVAHGAAYKMLTGNKFWWAELLDAGANAGLPQELFALPSQYMSIIARTGWPVKTIGYQLNAGPIRRFEKESVLHEKFFNPAYDDTGSHLYGQSPLMAARKNLTRNNYAKVATTARFENSGSDTIVWVDDDRLTPDEGIAQAKAVKQILMGEGVGPENNGKIPVSGIKMGATNLKEALKDMEIWKGEDLDLRRLANIWGVPSQLLNDPENKAEANVVEAERQLTSRCVLTQLSSTRDNINRKTQEDWGLKGQNAYIDYDLSVYRELQEDQGKKWTWVKELTVPEAYKLEMMGLDVPDSLPKDLIIVDGNKMTLEDLINGITEDDMNQINDKLIKAGLNDYNKY